MSQPDPTDLNNVEVDVAIQLYLAHLKGWLGTPLSDEAQDALAKFIGRKRLVAVLREEIERAMEVVTLVAEIATRALAADLLLAIHMYTDTQNPLSDRDVVAFQKILAEFRVFVALINGKPVPRKFPVVRIVAPPSPPPRPWLDPPSPPFLPLPHVSSTPSSVLPTVPSAAEPTRHKAPPRATHSTDYICRWDGCGESVAKADSLAHMHKHGIGPHRDQVCMWANCKPKSNQRKDESGRGYYQNLTQHMRNQHVWSSTKD